MKKILLITVLGMMLTAATSYANPIIDFSTGLGSFGGIVTKSGSDYSGVNIRIGSVTISGSPLNNGTYAVTGAAGGFGALSFNTATNSISIVGSIAGLGINSPITLLSGGITTFTPTLQLGGNLFINAAGPDVKASTLLATLGLAPSSWFNYFGFNIANRKLSNPNQWEAFSTDIVNVAPEPTSIILLGSGLLGLAGLARKRLG